jgi:hypothetical protein
MQIGKAEQGFFYRYLLECGKSRSKLKLDIEERTQSVRPFLSVYTRFYCSLPCVSSPFYWDTLLSPMGQYADLKSNTTSPAKAM